MNDVFYSDHATGTIILRPRARRLLKAILPKQGTHYELQYAMNNGGSLVVADGRRMLALHHEKPEKVFAEGAYMITRDGFLLKVVEEVSYPDWRGLIERESGRERKAVEVNGSYIKERILFTMNANNVLMDHKLLLPVLKELNPEQCVISFALKPASPESSLTRVDPGLPVIIKGVYSSGDGEPVEYTFLAMSVNF